MISFRHATVLACTGADPVYDATVIVEGAVIKDVLTSARPAAGAGGEVIDCGGRTVMPGLIDAHVHVCAVEVDLSAQRRDYPPSLLAYAAGMMIRQALDQGFTTVRDAGGADWGMKEAVDRGLIPGPRMFVSGHPLSQSGGHGDSRTRAESYPGCGCGAELGMVPNIADGVDEVRRAVRTQLRRGADAIKVMAGGGVASPTDRLESPQYRPDELSAAVAEAEAAGTYVLAHAYTPAAIRNAVQAGVRSIEHGNFLDEATAALMAAKGTFLVPTFVTYEKLHEHGRERGLAAAQLAKLDLVLAIKASVLGAHQDPDRHHQDQRRAARHRGRDGNHRSRKAGRPARGRRRSAGRHRRAAASGQPDGDRQGRPVPQAPDLGRSASS